MSAAKEKTISDRTWNGDQSWYRELIVSVGKSRVRYKVRVNAYDFQSYGKAELWNGSEWKTVHQIPGQQLRAIKTVSYVSAFCSPVEFDEDLAELRSVVRAII